MCSMERSRLQGDLTAAFQYLRGAYEREGDQLFTQSDSDSMRENGFKPQEGKFRLDAQLANERITLKYPKPAAE